MPTAHRHPERFNDAPTRALRWMTVAAGLLACAGLLFVSLQRLVYPFEIEWIEGSSVDHVLRILRGRKLYVEPTAEFIPQLYTPLYFYVSAAVAKVTGVGFMPLRLVSLCAALGALLGLYVLVQRETRSHAAGLVSAGLFAASYGASGTWFEVAHSDSLMLFFFLAALALARSVPSRKGYAVAGVLLGLAFFSKQTAAVLAAALLAGALATRPRWAIAAGSVAAATAGFGWLALDALHEGWFTFYAWKLPKGHAFDPKMWTEFWTLDLLRVVPIALVAALSWIASRHAGAPRERAFWASLLAGSVAVAWLGRLHSGGFANVLMPLHATLALFFGMAWRAALQAESRWLRCTLALALLAQFGLLAYDPRSALPSAADRAAGEELMRRLEQVDGDVYIPFHGYYASLTGHAMHAHTMAVTDVKRADPELGAAVEAELERRIQRKEFAALVLDRLVFRGVVQKNYVELEPPPIAGEDAFLPVVGVRARPRYFMVPRTVPQ